MNELNRNTPSVGGGGRKVLAMFGAMVLIALTLYASRDSLPPTPVAAAEDAKDKKATDPAPRAVEAANAFLDSLDDKLREKATLEYASEKKPNWSNLPVTFVPRNG